MKLSHSFLIAASMITLSANGFADQTAGEPKCPCAAMEKPSNDKTATPLHHEEEPYDDAHATHERNFSCSDPAKCGALAKPANNEEPHCEANQPAPNGNEKACKDENDNCYYVECDDVYCRYYPLSLSHTEGHWFDNRTGYTSINWFWPFPAASNCNCFPLIDVRSHVLNDGTTAGNFGGGLRVINGCNCSTIFGANAFYDFRKTACNEFFQQFGIGFEILNPCLDFRFNGYFPFDRDRGCIKEGHITCEHDTRFFLQWKRVLTGFDASIGKWIVKDACGVFDYYATLGIYSYFPRKHGKGIFGGEVRLMANLIRYLSLELRGGYDTTNGTQAQGTLAVYIPLGESPCHCFTNSYLENNCYLRERVCQPLLRQEIISFERQRCCFRKQR